MSPQLLISRPVLGANWVSPNPNFKFPGTEINWASWGWLSTLFWSIRSCSTKRKWWPGLGKRALPTRGSVLRRGVTSFQRRDRLSIIPFQMRWPWNQQKKHKLTAKLAHGTRRQEWQAAAPWRSVPEGRHDSCLTARQTCPPTRSVVLLRPVSWMTWNWDTGELGQGQGTGAVETAAPRPWGLVSTARSFAQRRQRFSWSWQLFPWCPCFGSSNRHRGSLSLYNKLPQNLAT